MMKRILTLSIVSTFFLVSSIGCSSKEVIQPIQEIKTIVEYKYTKCESDKRPEYKKLDDTTHIGSAYNVNILVDNIMIIKDYSESLERTIGCYEAQIKEEPVK